MAQTASAKAHSLHIENRSRLTASGVTRVDFFSETLITVQTADGRLHIKGEGLYIENMSADSFEIGSSLTGRVALSLHVSADDDIRGRQPLVFASSGSFAANRESFKVKKVYGSPYMFDILYKEEDGGLKKSWSLVMNDTPNPDYRPAADTPAENAPDPETLKDTPPEEGKAETSPAAEKSVSQTMPDCRGNPGCLFFKALNRATSVIYLIIAGTHKITDTTLTAIENALCGFMVRLNKAVSFFAPEAEPAGETPAGPKAAKTTEPSV